MLDLAGLPAYSAAQVEATTRLRARLRAISLRPAAPAPPIQGFVPCAARDFQAPVQLALDSRLGALLVTLERAAIEAALDRIMPDWRAEDADVLPFDWCVTCAFDLYAAGTPLADAGLSVSLGKAVLAHADAPGPTQFGTVLLDGSRWLISVTLMSDDPARIGPAPPPPGAGAPLSLPVRVALSLLAPRIGLEALRGLASGDVVLIGRGGAAGLTARVRLNDSMILDGVLSEAAGFVADRPASRSQPMDLTDRMPGDRRTMTAPATRDLAAMPLDDLPMHLEVQFRRKTMTLADIGALASGAILDLGIDLSEPVVLNVNGEPVGTGRLVRIGDLVGVQIDRWSAGPQDAPAGDAADDFDLQIDAR
jgi:type III secretion system YscQ/HrcQ family protein